MARDPHPSPLRPIWVTADDYGLTAGVNAAIEQLAQQRAITAVSVMCHPGAVHAGVGRLAASGVATGLHLVLCEERPLALVPGDALLERDGRLPADHRALFARIVRRPGVLESIACEVRAQLARFGQLGLPLHFVNSHQHVHLFPPLWRRLRRLLEGAPAARVRAIVRPRRLALRDDLLGLSSWLALRWAPLAGRRRLRPVGVQCAGTLDAAQLRSLLPAVAPAEDADEIVELVAHPGDGDSDTLARYGHWRYRWQDERDFIGSGDLRAILHGHGWELAGPP